MGFGDKLRNLKAKVIDATTTKLHKNETIIFDGKRIPVKSRAQLAMERFNLTKEKYEELKAQAREQVEQWRIAAPAAYIEEIMKNSKAKNPHYQEKIVESPTIGSWLTEKKEVSARIAKKPGSGRKKGSNTDQDTCHPAKAQSLERKKKFEKIAFGYQKEKALLEFHVNRKLIVIPQQLKHRKRVKKEVTKKAKKHNYKHENVGVMLANMRKNKNRTVQSLSGPQTEARILPTRPRRKFTYRLNTTDNGKSHKFPVNWYAPGSIDAQKHEKGSIFWTGEDDIDIGTRDEISGEQSVTLDNVLEVALGRKKLEETGVKPPSENQKLMNLGIVWNDMEKTAKSKHVFMHTLTGCVESARKKAKASQSQNTSKSRKTKIKEQTVHWDDTTNIVVFEGSFMGRQEKYDVPHRKLKEKLVQHERGA